MSEHQTIADLLADLLNEQRATTAAIASLAVAIANAGQGSPAVQAETAKVIEKAAKAPAPKPSPAPAAAPSEPVAPVAETVAPTAPSEVTYDDVAALVIKCSKANGRPFTVDLLRPFGITALPAAKPEQFADILRVFEVAMA
jgi:hypothetical protein